MPRTTGVSGGLSRSSCGLKTTAIPAPSADRLMMECQRCAHERTTVQNTHPKTRWFARSHRRLLLRWPTLPLGMTCSGAPGDPCAADSAHPVFGAPAATKVVDRQGKVEKRLLLCQSIRSIGGVALRRPTIGGAPHAPAAGGSTAGRPARAKPALAERCHHGTTLHRRWP
ncbi:hypothetical protein MTO96_004120 [Rhipicephalus appendiculatus]